MKISIKQILTLFVVIVAGFMGAMFYLSEKQDDVKDAVLKLDEKAFKIGQQASQLNVIVADYNLYRSPTSLLQWSATLDKIERHSVHLLNITHLEEKVLAKRLDTDISRIRMQFELLRDATIDTDIQWITINLNTYSQNLITQLHNLSHEARQIASEDLSKLSYYQYIVVTITAVFSIVLLVILYSALILPLKAVKTELKRIGECYDQHDHHSFKKSRINEWHELTLDIEEMYQQLKTTTVSKKALLDEVEMRKEAEDNANSQARTDFLTGLPNRRSFFEHFEALLERRNKRAFLLFLDIDNFKSYNDNLGHIAGDAILNKVSAAVLEVISVNDKVARLGGDEFAILHFADSDEGAHEFARSLQQKIRMPIDFESTQLRIDCSIGIACFPDDSLELKQLLSCADTAMYFAKRNPVTTSGIQRFTSEIGTESKTNFNLYHQLRKSVEQQDFEVWFQPQIDMTTLSVSGFEALLRWKKADGSYVSPSEFVPMLERTVDIVRVGELVFEKSIAFQRKLAALGMDHYVSVNISVVQLERSDFVDYLRALIINQGLEASKFPLELTETAIFQNKSATLNSLNKLNELGFSLQLDDFGTGNASLDLLKNFPFSIVKIDKSFTQEALNKPETRAVVKAITGLSKDLNFDVIIEGVETAKQQALAREFGIKFAQGYFYAQAMPMDEAIEWRENYQQYSAAL
ncbi:EAL domain-containing protein [Vibrio sp. SCSIO 43140]|uniref:putative bifunctional diguanylate cyclase/phosphodiesterase n=1 Tax=Vibrio sp. SCSIO 43140 TaxID=2819100 RepID=UPI002075DE36|nr:EAL domain-containing protein [Vibrio sp. SCSIO 43140]USD62014.1 EAL domain-containing protein [Vibrio sp. SCSIO 43140]